MATQTRQGFTQRKSQEAAELDSEQGLTTCATHTPESTEEVTLEVCLQLRELGIVLLS